MFRKPRSNNLGFTIIEVVITIAIGAAVMALVLNAVAGARRSQRNNARQADVNQVAAAVNSYIATRNQLPEHYGEINTIVDTGLGHYTPSHINAVASWTTTLPLASSAAFCTPATAGATQAACIDPLQGTPPAAGVWTPASSTGRFEWNAAYLTAPAATTNMGTAGNSDYMVVINEAACDATNVLPVAAGIREVVVVYRLEGQADTLCLEI